jgi:phosphoinositide-3-kinase, regulatory subunit 4
MGNQISTPSQIFPVEHYLIGLESEIQYESSLGSTRFLKAARAKSEEGLVVVKVFAKNDPTLPLEVHAEKLETIKKSLQNAVNCLPFQKVLVSRRGKGERGIED